jgi:hypothetical protein
LRKQEEIATLDLDLQEVEVRFTVQTDQALEVFLVLHLDHRRDLQEMFLVLQDLVLETIQAQDLQQDQVPGQVQDLQEMFLVHQDLALETIQAQDLQQDQAPGQVRDLQEMFLVLQDLVLETIQAQDLQQDQAPGQVRDLQEMFLALQDLALETIDQQMLVTEIVTLLDHLEELFIEAQHKEEPVTIEVIIIDQIGTDLLFITTHTTTHIIPVYLIIDLIGHPREDILTHFLTLQFIGTLG